MDARARAERRIHALVICFASIVSGICALLWVALLSFDIADAPSASVWPEPQRPNNWCGIAGASVAYWTFYYLGLGAYLLLALLTGAAIALFRRVAMNDLWLRAVGLTLVCAGGSAAAALFLPATDRYPMSGPGGVLGAVTADFLILALQTPGAVIMLVCSIFVGLMLVADEAVIRVARWTLGISQRSAPILVRGGGAAIASAGAAVAASVSTVSNRIAAARSWKVSGRPPANGATAAPSPSRAGVIARSPASAPTPDDDHESELEIAPPARPVARPAPPPRDFDLDDEDAADDALAEAQAHGGPSGGNGALPSSAAPITAIRVTPMKASVEAPPRKVDPLPSPPQSQYELPPMSLLEEADPINREAIESLCREKALILKQTLTEFKLDVDVVAIETGPVVTVFELRLAPGIKVRQIVSLSNDMARALKAPAVRVVAPMPGKNTIGIEVPNLDKEKVRIKDVMRAAMGRGYALPLFLGKDASGQPLISDLTKMPHLLIAGTTGSGKSVCVSSIIMSFLLTRTPGEVQMVLVDPKVVELAMFKDIPHLMCPIVTEMSKAEGILDWATNKMDERYALLAEAGVKDIRAYNKLGEAGIRERMQIPPEEELRGVPVFLPYIVIVIDELADMMMTAAKEVEFYLCRLAQKSRAVGIHLIVSTQRPQANVVTGLIKANLPCRIAFRVSSRLDSRIVLDQNGGEVLMGQGDMLFLPPGSAKLVRAQGTYIADDELRGIVKHCRGQGHPNFHPELVRSPKGDAAAGERDELFDQAVDIILETGRGSVSLLQRRLTIGYGRASRLIDQMAVSGIVGEYKGSQAREIAVTKEEWQAIKSQRDREQAAEDAD